MHRLFIICAAVLIPVLARSADGSGRVGILLGIGSAENAHYYGERYECTDTDLEAGAVYRSGNRWYAEGALGWRASDRSARNAGTTAPPLDSGHLRITAGYRADRFNRTDINLVAGFELAAERWYDDSLYIHSLARPARSAGITVPQVGAPYEITYAYSVIIPKLFIGIEPNMALNEHLRAVIRYGFELRFLPSERFMDFSTAGGVIDDEKITGEPLDNARSELGAKLTATLQYLF